MAKKQMNGRVSLEQKNNLSEYEFGNKAKSMLDIPESCQKELDAAGLEGRWIDVVELKKNHGWHKREWAPHKFTCLGKSEANPFGASDGQYDGYLIRKQLVLAAKKKELAQARRNYVQMRAKMQSNPGKTSIDEFKKYIRENDQTAKVLEGHDDGDGDEQPLKRSFLKAVVEYCTNPGRMGWGKLN